MALQGKITKAIRLSKYSLLLLVGALAGFAAVDGNKTGTIFDGLTMQPPSAHADVPSGGAGGGCSGDGCAAGDSADSGGSAGCADDGGGAGAADGGSGDGGDA